MKRCDEANKRIYGSHGEAIEACANQYIMPYLCRFCFHWHIGHTSKTRRDERRAMLKQMVIDAEAAGLYDMEEL